MSERLGEYLVKAGKITEQQLSSVLERQVTLGGGFGTNLVGLGFLTEKDLLAFLSGKLGLSTLQASDLEQIDPALIKLIPAHIARKYKVVPIQRERNRLALALQDPTDLEAMDELGFITGCSILPHIASEESIRTAIERFYPSPPGQEQTAEAKQGALEASDAPPLKKDFSAKDLDEVFEQTRKKWVDARDRDAAIATFLTAVHNVLDRAVLFLVKGEKLGAWKGIPASVEAATAGLEFKRVAGPDFDSVIMGRNPFHGPPSPDHPAYQVLFKALDVFPAEVLLLPILVKDQVVAILYGDNSGRPIKSIDFLGRLGHKLAMTLEILILKKKILEL